MKKFTFFSQHQHILFYLFRWTILVFPVALIVGSLVAFFLWLLDEAISLGFKNNWLLYLLPLGGILIHFLYRLLGKNAEGGNNLVIDEIHNPNVGVPFRMAPLVLFTTVVTHLFGGSAGREGTAVQIGGSIAQYFARVFKLSKQDISTLLTAGVAAGFGAVFGTPVTGAIFAIEVLAFGKIKYNALLPCFIASLLADIVTTAWGITHTNYIINFNDAEKIISEFIHFDFLLLIMAIVAGAAFGLAGLMFIKLSHGIKNQTNNWIKTKWLIPVFGGFAIIALTFALGTRDYLSLGVTNPNPDSVSIVSCFKKDGATYFSWFWKLLFTAITIGTGFKGGEVTPLFFIGAALGNTIAALTGAPIDLFAGLGFIAVFASATNTPIACTMMGVELFGGDNILYYAVACFTAYYFSGHSGIYNSQKVGVAKVSGLQNDINKTI